MSWPLQAISFGMITLITTLRLGSSQQATASSPHVVIVLADDMGYGDVGCYNPQSIVHRSRACLHATDGVARHRDGFMLSRTA